MIKVFELGGTVDVDADRAIEALKDVDSAGKKVAVSLDNEVDKSIKNVNSDLKQTEVEGKTAENRMVSMVKNGIKIAAIAGAVREVYQAVKSLVTAYFEQENAQTRLETIAKNVTIATDAQIESMKRLAKEVESYTTYGDDVIMAGQSQLLSFGIQTESAGKLTESMANLLAANKGMVATQEDAISAANLMGKALNGEAGSLREVGIIVTSHQAQLLKSNNEMTRVNTMIEIMDSNYKGLARTMGETTQGNLLQASNTFKDMKEVIGAQLTPAIVAIANQVKDSMPQIQKAVSMVVPVFLLFAEVILFVAKNFQFFLPIIAAVLTILLAYKIVTVISGMMTAFSAVMAITSATTATAGVTSAAASTGFFTLGMSMQTVLPIILLVTAALVALASVIYLIKGSSLNVSAAVTSTTKAAGATYGGAAISTGNLGGTTNNYNSVSVPAKDVKEFSDVNTFFNQVGTYQGAY